MFKNFKKERSKRRIEKGNLSYFKACSLLKQLNNYCDEDVTEFFIEIFEKDRNSSIANYVFDFIISRKSKNLFSVLEREVNENSKFKVVSLKLLSKMEGEEPLEVVLKNLRKGNLGSILTSKIIVNLDVKNKKVQDLLLFLLEHQDYNVRRTSLMRLSNCDSSSRAFQIAFLDKEYSIRIEVLTAILALKKTDDFLDLFESALCDADPNIREIGVTVLKEKDEYFPNLFDLAKDEDVEIRFQVLKAISKNPESLDLIKDALIDESKKIRILAASLLLESDDDSVFSILMNFHIHKNPELRLISALNLEKRGSREEIEKYLPFLKKDSNPKVRKVALRIQSATSL